MKLIIRLAAIEKTNKRSGKEKYGLGHEFQRKCTIHDIYVDIHS